MRFDLPLLILERQQKKFEQQLLEVLVVPIQVDSADANQLLRLLTFSLSER